MNRLSFCSISFLVMLAVVPITAMAASPLQQDAFQPASREELIERLAGKTIFGKHVHEGAPNQYLEQFFLPDGRIFAHNWDDQGNHWTNRDELFRPCWVVTSPSTVCYLNNRESKPDEQCWEYTFTSPTTFEGYMINMPQLRAFLATEEGNPRRLSDLGFTWSCSPD